MTEKRGAEGRATVLATVLRELDATDQALVDDPDMPGSAADYAADIVRVLGRYFLGEDEFAKVPQVIVMVVDTSTEEDDEFDAMPVLGGVWRDGDLVLVCPSCAAVNEVAQRDRATCEHDLVVEEDWVSVADTRHADFHDLDYICLSCRTVLDMPAADETRIVWG